MKIAGILLIAIAVTSPQGRQGTQSQPTLAPADHRQLYSPSAVHGTSPLYQRRCTWYEFLLRQFNPDDIDYGSRLEKRRQIFLEASVNNPYFKYSAGLTLGLLLMTLLIVKQRIDHRRCMWITAEMMTDLYKHDAYSRQIAREAIDRYNDHIERCNRAIEASEHDASATDSEADRLRAELQSVTAERDSYRRERDLAKQDLVEKERVLADVSLRLDALVKKAESGRNSVSTQQLQGADQKLVQHINTLQEQLYAERRENKRLKGA
jgi:septal ring factor EnvC (AmiA/AmiB activator)